MLYDIAIFVYRIILRIAAIWHPKAKKWVAGRKGGMAQIALQMQGTAQRVWIHCASLGEFEQGRSIMEALKKQYPAVQIILTFFSPSGYEVRKNEVLADHVFYLPIDTCRNASEFLNLVKPQLVIFVKYEFWYHYLHQLKARQIPVLLVSAFFRKQQIFFQWYGFFFRKLLHAFEQVFVQDDLSQALLRSRQLQACTVVGDTRIDRVAQMATAVPRFPFVEEFTRGERLWIIGSSWPKDEQLWTAFCHTHPFIRLIWAPHEVDEAHLRRIVNSLGGLVIRYSSLLKGQGVDREQVLLIDNVGMLAGLYQYGYAAYIGGGFDDGIHNILEPAAFGLPVLFGPHYHQFREAEALVKLGGARVVHDPASLARQVALLDNKETHARASKAAKAYIAQNTGATDKIMAYIAAKRFLTNA